jgi:tyrosine-specific transport protein
MSKLGGNIVNTGIVSDGKISFSATFTSSLLVLGNVLGVGVLALPITAGMGGFIPSLIGIVIIWSVMLLSALLIAYRLDASKKNFDMPSFYQRELGTFFKWLAIACNLLILYGVLVAYLSGISSMFTALFPSMAGANVIVILVYFFMCSFLVTYGIKALRKGMIFIIIAIWISFFIMVFLGFESFNLHLLTYTDWRYVPVCLPLAVSAFHFHNIIPTVSKSLKYNKVATYKAIFIGVFMGLIVNLLWVIIVLGAIPVHGVGHDTIAYSSVHNLTANVPLSDLLHSKVFTISGLVFAILAVTSSFMTNGAGLYGFVKDMTFNYLKTENCLVVAGITFLPVLGIVLVYPDIFISALSVVGGIGEDLLFAVLPAIIIIKIAKQFKFKRCAFTVGSIMLLIGVFVFIYVLLQKFGLVHIIH